MTKWLSALGLCLLFLALRWNNFDLPLVRDEGEYAYAARLLRCGQAPYEQAFLQKPPMVAYSYALCDWLAPQTFWFPRVLAGLFVALATVLLGLIARREFGPGLAWPTMWLLTPLVVQPGIEEFTANIEMFMLLPLMALVALFVIGRGGAHGSICWLLAGGLAATTFWYKYTALPLLAFLFAAWSVHEWQVDKSGRALWRRWGLALLGAFAVSGAVLALFLARDGGKHLYECTVLFNRFYSTSSAFGLADFWWRVRLLWANWWILFVLVGVLLVRPDRRVWLWLGLFAAAWLATSGSVYGHYYILLMPFWAVLAAVAVVRVSGGLAARLSWSAVWLRRAMTAAAVLLVCLPQQPWITRTRAEFAALRLGGGNPFIESVPVAARVAQLTGLHDYVFVAGSEPQLLCYAHRFSPTRFVIAYPLMIPSPLARGYQQEAIGDLERRPPAVIVVAMSNKSWLVQRESPPDFSIYLKDLLAKNYEQIGGYVLERQGGQWTEPLARAELPKASLVVFRRKAP